MNLKGRLARPANPLEGKWLAATGSPAAVGAAHEERAVFRLADTISALVYGRVIASGTPAQIKNDPDVKKAYLGEEAT